MEFLKKKEIKITSYVILGIFLVFLVLNSCNPITMGQFASWNNAGNIILSLIRWISFIGIATLPLAIIYNKDKYKQLSMYVVLPCLIISLCASGQYFSLYDISTFYVVIHYLYHIFGILLCLYILLTYDFRNTKFSAKNFFITLLLLILGTFPLNIFQQSEALMNSGFLTYRIFGWWHLFFMVLLFAALLFVRWLLSKKSKEEAHLAMLCISIILLHQLLTRFSVVSTGSYHSLSNIFAALPLYLCSFGIVLMPFAIASKNKFFQTMLFMANMPGAFCVFVYLDPGAGFSILHYNVLYFVYNHLFIFVLSTLLPKFCQADIKFKYLLHLLYISVIFIIFVSICNNICVINGFNPNYSYVASCPLPIGNITTIGVLTIGSFTFPVVWLIILTLFYNLIFVVGLSFYRLVLLINNKIKDRKKDVCDRIIDIVKADI